MACFLLGEVLQLLLHCGQCRQRGSFHQLQCFSCRLRLSFGLTRSGVPFCRHDTKLPFTLELLSPQCTERLFFFAPCLF